MLSTKKQAEHTEGYSRVLMDCQMPTMDGYEATRSIREGNAGGNNRDITIIAMIANAMSGDKKKCLAAGMNDYMSKPVDPDDLERLLKQWLLPQSSAA